MNESADTATTGQLAEAEPAALGHRGLPGRHQQRAEGQADRAAGAAARARSQHGAVPQRRGGQEEDRIDPAVVGPLPRRQKALLILPCSLFSFVL